MLERTPKGTLKMLPNQRSKESAVRDLVGALKPLYELLNSVGNLTGLRHEANTAKRDVVTLFLEWHYRGGGACDVCDVFVRKLLCSCGEKHHISAEKATRLFAEIVRRRCSAMKKIVSGLSRDQMLARELGNVVAAFEAATRLLV